MEATTDIRNAIACFSWNGREYVVTRGTSNEVLATFKTLKLTRAFVESFNAKLATSL